MAVNYTQYLAANTDLIRAGITLQTAEQHYLQYGRYENRNTTFNSTSYVAANADLIAAGVRGDAAAAHYISNGYAENRSTTFNSTSYVAANTDLIAAGVRGDAAAAHYISNGYSESRSTTFNSAGYILANNLTGFTSADQAASNYISSGYSQNLSTSYDFSTINTSSYASAYSDLSSAFSNTTTRDSQLLSHFLNYGIYEGRVIPTSTPTTSTSTPVIGSTGQITGSISSSGEQDSYNVTLNAGTTYTLDMRGASSSGGTLYDPYLRLYDPGNNQVAYDDNTGSGSDARIVYTPTTSGVFRLTGSSSSTTYRPTGSYTIAVRWPRTALERTVGEISTAGERDAYAVSLTADQEYTFDMRGYYTNDGTLRTPNLTLNTSTGIQLAASSTAHDSGSLQRLTFTPSVSGLYSLVAASSSNSYSGSYVVSGSYLA